MSPTLRPLRTKVVVLIAIALSIACSAKEPQLVGHWKSSRSTFVVTRDGDVYTVVVTNHNGMLGGTYVGLYRDGVIQVKGPLSAVCSEIRYARDTDHLQFCGEEFARIPG